MSHQRIADSLSALFSTHPVVFWHDVDAEFSAAIDSLPPSGVQLVRLDDTPFDWYKDTASQPRLN